MCSASLPIVPVSAKDSFGEALLYHDVNISVLGNEIVREGLTRLLRTRGFSAMAWPLTQLSHCIASFTTDREQLVIVDAASIDVAIDICHSIRDDLDRVLIILISDAAGQDHDQLATVGIDGLVARSASLDSICEMVNRLLAKAAECPQGCRSETGSCMGEKEAEQHRHLSGREIEILLYLANGDTNKVIAQYLHITEALVKAHVKTILRKLQLANRTQAAIWALRRGFALQQDDRGVDGDNQIENGDAQIF